MESNSTMELEQQDCAVTVKRPKRILHFSDGTLEEYSDSEEAEQTIVKTEDVVDTANMGWGPWLVYKAVRTGSTTLAVCDYVGEALASFLGITTPKYQYELDEYMRIQKQRKINADNSSGWLNDKSDGENGNNDTVVDSHPKSTVNNNINN